MEFEELLGGKLNLLKLLHADREAHYERLLQAIGVLFHENRGIQFGHKKYLQLKSLIDLIELCGDYVWQSKALQLLLVQDDVKEYGPWFASVWFQGMPKTEESFLNVSENFGTHDVRKILNFYNEETQLFFVFSMSCSSFRWNGMSPLPENMLCHWLDLNCGSKSLRISDFVLETTSGESIEAICILGKDLTDVNVLKTVTQGNFLCVEIIFKSKTGELAVLLNPHVVFDCDKFHDVLSYIAGSNLNYNEQSIATPSEPAVISCSINKTPRSSSMRGKRKSCIQANVAPDSSTMLGEFAVPTNAKKKMRLNLPQKLQRWSWSMDSSELSTSMKLRSGREYGVTPGKVCQGRKHRSLAGSSSSTPDASQYCSNVESFTGCDEATIISQVETQNSCNTSASTPTHSALDSSTVQDVALVTDSKGFLSSWRGAGASVTCPEDGSVQNGNDVVTGIEGTSSPERSTLYTFMNEPLVTNVRIGSYIKEESPPDNKSTSTSIVDVCATERTTCLEASETIKEGALNFHHVMPLNGSTRSSSLEFAIPPLKGPQSNEVALVSEGNLQHACMKVKAYKREGGFSCLVNSPQSESSSSPKVLTQLQPARCDNVPEVLEESDPKPTLEDVPTTAPACVPQAQIYSMPSLSSPAWFGNES